MCTTSSAWPPFARKADALFVLDAAQTAGAWAFSASGIGADVVCFTGHKACTGRRHRRAVRAPGPLISPRLWKAVRACTASTSDIRASCPRRSRPERPMPTAWRGLRRVLLACGARGGGCASAYRRVGDAFPGRRGRYRRCEGPRRRLRQRCGIVAVNVGDADSGEIADRLAQGWACASARRALRPAHAHGAGNAAAGCRAIQLRRHEFAAGLRRRLERVADIACRSVLRDAHVPNALRISKGPSCASSASPPKAR